MTTTTSVPFLDLAQTHAALEKELSDAVLPLIRQAAFIGGPVVTRFEEAYARAHGLPHAVGMKSGTSALQLALEAMGVGAGAEVLVPAHTFIATAAAVSRAGATPIFVDVDDETACMDPQAAAAAVTPRTKAMIPVHLYGHPAPMPALLDLAKKHNLRVIEDCAQSHLATLDGKITGTMGDVGAFSFYPSKNLGAGGDAGAIVTRDGDLAETVRRLTNHGRIDRYHHGMLGWNERLDSIQAAILEVKLRHLPKWNEMRREVAGRYHKLLKGVSVWGEPLRLPVEKPGAKAVYHLYVVRHSKRDALGEALGKLGVGTAVHYPMTVPAQPAFQKLGLGKGSYPVSETWAATCISLPFYPELTEAHQERVAEALRSIR